MADIFNKKYSIEEKLKMLTGVDGFAAVHPKDVQEPLLRMSDSPIGVKKGGSKAMCYPNPCLVASSFDRELMFQLGKALGTDCRAYNCNLLLAPAVNLKRSPLAGRNFEYYSEDPYLSGVLVGKFVDGLHSEKVGVCVKHFACNNQETARWVQDSVVDDDTLRNVYLKAFEMLVKNNNIETIMSSYNQVNGTYAAENKYLLNDILKGEWGFDGIVISDWASVRNLVNSFNNGLDLEMPNNNNSFQVLKDAYEKGELSEETINESVRRLLKVSKKLNITVSNHDSTSKKFNADDISKMASESMVLLKNEGVLPLSKTDKVLLVGEAAVKPRIQGGGCAEIKDRKFLKLPQKHLKEKLAKCDCIGNYDILELGTIDLGSYDKIIVFTCLTRWEDSEAYDRKSLGFPEEQVSAIKYLSKYNDNIIVVLENGSAVDLNFEKDVKGILEAYYTGDCFGTAVSDVLTGEITPSGKLAETFPERIEDLPNLYEFGKRTVYYKEGEFFGYRYFSTFNVKPKYEFGFGLTYCNFKWKNIKIDKVSDYGFDISLDVENVSNYHGKEVVQIYLKSENVFEPRKQLLEFDCIRLAPHEEKHVIIKLRPEHFTKYISGKQRLISGEYGIVVGRSSEIDEYTKQVVLKKEEDRVIDFDTMLGELLGNDKFRNVTLKYLRDAINYWAFGDENSEENFEDNGFLKSHVYDMPIRGIAYFVRKDDKMQILTKMINELTEIKENKK